MRHVAIVGSMWVLACSAQPPPTPSPYGVTRPDPAPKMEPDPAQTRQPVPAAPVAEDDPGRATPPVEAAPPKPGPFDGREVVRVGELWPALEQVALDMEASDRVQSDYAAFVARHDLVDEPDLYRDYVRVKLAFEATRDGGLWGLRWDITNRKPRSDEVWAQWTKLDAIFHDKPTATAECDELSALFAFVARRLGVDRIGLMWPRWNHVVAVWTVQQRDRDPVRVVVPTSQVFLDADASLGTDGFDPWSQKTIYTYRRRDASDQLKLPGVVARYFVAQILEHAASPQVELQRMRNERSALLGGS